MNKDELIKEIRKSDQFKEIWLRKDTGASICALINGDFGWLMYLKHANDFGFSSRNPEFESKEKIPFKLNNGQIDEYPKNWVYPVSAFFAIIQPNESSCQKIPSYIWPLFRKYSNASRTTLTG